MTDSVLEEITRYYSERYDVVAHYPFQADKKIRLQDHEDQQSRRCRFCNRRKPDVSFTNDAHAVPQFLGNRDILSYNECDKCNEFLAYEYEDHLSKWSQFARATSQIKGKKRKPTFKNPAETMRVGPGKNGLAIELTDPNLAGNLMREGGPDSFTLPTDATSQPYIPKRAAMALIKIGCSICPLENLPQCVPAIDWLMRRAEFHIEGFPVLYSFTPGPINDKASEVVLLRRKVDEPIPFMWLAVQFRNHRLQVFMPFCPADSEWLTMGEEIKLTFKHLPNRFGPNWPYGKTKYGHADWSGTDPVTTSATATFHVENARRIDKEGQD